MKGFVKRTTPAISALSVFDQSRTKNISNARHIAIYLCRRHLDLPFAKIGDEFGKRDHSTIISSCEKIDKELKKDSFMSVALGEIEKLLI